MKKLLASIVMFFSLIEAAQSYATVLNWVSHQSSLDGTGLVSTIITSDPIPTDTGGVLLTDFRTYYRVWLGDYLHTPTEGETYGRLILDILDGDIKSTRALFGNPLVLDPALRPSPTELTGGLETMLGPI
jgi:hypothetical protein